jgi:hypothetical protein
MKGLFDIIAMFDTPDAFKNAAVHLRTKTSTSLSYRNLRASKDSS